MENNYKKMPCGNCKCGVYAQEAIDAGNLHFETCQTRKEALKISPKCIHEINQICYGALDFILTTEFPILQKVAA